MKGWKGNVTADSSLLNPVIAASSQQATPTARLLTQDETQKIRGAFFFFFIPLIFAAIANIGAAVFTVISAIGTIIASIGSLVGTILSGVGQFLGAVLNGIGYIGNAIWQGISFAASTLWGALGNVGSFLSQNVFGSLAKAGFGNTLFQQAVRTGLNFAVSRGLESLGVNPTISNLISAFVTGGYQGLANPISITQAAEGVTRATMIASSIFQSVAIEGVGQLGIHFGLDSGFTNILSLSLAAIGGQVIQNPTTTIEKAFSNIKPQLFSSLGQYGVDKLGTSIGLSSILSSAIGLPISSALAATLTQTQYTGQMDPNAQNQMSFDTSGYYDKSTNQNIYFNPGTPEQTWWDSFLGFMRTNLLSMIQSGISAYYTSTDTINASTIPTTTNLAPIPVGAVALNYQNPFTNLIQTSYQINTSSGYLIYDRQTGFLLKRVTGNVVEEGVFNYKIVRQLDGSFTTDLRNPTDLNLGTTTYSDAYGGKVDFDIAHGQVDGLRVIEGQSPDIRLELNVVQEPVTNKILSGIAHILGLTLYVTNGTVSQGDGSGVGSGEISGTLLRSYIFGNGFNNAVVPLGTPDELIPSYMTGLESKGIINKLQEYLVPMYEITNLFGNLVAWAYNFMSSDDVKAFVQALSLPNNLMNDIMTKQIPLTSIPEPFRDWAKNIQAWYDSFFSGLSTNLVAQVVATLKQLELGKGMPIQDGIAFAHSGFFAPLIGALQTTLDATGKKFDVETIINYEGPTVDRNAYIDNPSLKRIINVWGTAPNQLVTGMSKYFPDDPAHPFTENDFSKIPVQVGDFGPPIGDLPWDVGKANYKGPAGITNINIEIVGARHNDFTYTDYKTDSNGNYVLDQSGNRIELWNRVPYAPEQLAREINFKTSVFMQNLYQAAKNEETNPGDLANFLRRTPGITQDSTGVWIVDARNLSYPLDYAY